MTHVDWSTTILGHKSSMPIYIVSPSIHPSLFFTRTILSTMVSEPCSATFLYSSQQTSRYSDTNGYAFVDGDCTRKAWSPGRRTQLDESGGEAWRYSDGAPLSLLLFISIFQREHPCVCILTMSLLFRSPRLHHAVSTRLWTPLNRDRPSSCNCKLSFCRFVVPSLSGMHCC